LRKEGSADIYPGRVGKDKKKEPLGIKPREPSILFFY